MFKDYSKLRAKANTTGKLPISFVKDSITRISDIMSHREAMLQINSIFTNTDKTLSYEEYKQLMSAIKGIQIEQPHFRDTGNTSQYFNLLSALQYKLRVMTKKEFDDTCKKIVFIY